MAIKKLIYLLLAASLVFMMSCDSSTEPEEKPVDELALVTAVGDVYFTEYTTASGGVNTTIDAVFANLNDGDDTNNPFIIDWRGSADYSVKHIKGAVNLALGDLVAKVNDGTIPTDKLIVNVCYSGQTASVATATLNLLGFDATNLKFGMCSVSSDPNFIPKSNNWANQIASDEYVLNKTDEGTPADGSGFPVLSTGQKTASDIIKANFANVTAGWNVSFANLIANPTDYFILNYWGASDYMDIGHIEGAYQFTPSVSLQKAEMLNKLPKDQKIAVYCWTGQTSAQVTAYLRLLGYDAYSVLYGVNGFAFTALPDGKPKYHEPTNDYSSILE